MLQRTLVLLKPDAVKRSVMGEIIHRFERCGLKLVGMKMVHIDVDFAKTHYSDHVEKAFYPNLEDYITSGPVLALAIEGAHAVDVVRKLVGPTEPLKAAPGTIRGDFAHHSAMSSDQKGKSVENLIHASGNLEDAKKEIELWFGPYEMHTYTSVHEKHTF